MVALYLRDFVGEIKDGEGAQWNQNLAKGTWNHEATLWNHVWKGKNWKRINFCGILIILNENKKEWKYA